MSKLLLFALVRCLEDGTGHFWSCVLCFLCELQCLSGGVCVRAGFYKAGFTAAPLLCLSRWTGIEILCSDNKKHNSAIRGQRVERGCAALFSLQKQTRWSLSLWHWWAAEGLWDLPGTQQEWPYSTCSKVWRPVGFESAHWFILFQGKEALQGFITAPECHSKLWGNRRKKK